MHENFPQRCEIINLAAERAKRSPRTQSPPARECPPFLGFLSTLAPPELSAADRYTQSLRCNDAQRSRNGAMIGRPLRRPDWINRIIAGLDPFTSFQGGGNDAA